MTFRAKNADGDLVEKIMLNHGEINAMSSWTMQLA